MRIFLLLSAFILIGLVYSCDDGMQTQKAYVKYNDSIVDIQSRCMKALDKYARVSHSENDSVRFAELDDLKAVFDSSLAELDQMGPFEDDDSFRQACVDLFRFYRKQTEDYYPEKIRKSRLAMQTVSKDERQKVKAKDEENSKKEKELTERLFQAQRDIAHKYNTKLGNK